MARVVLIGTLDTKGHEYAFLRHRLRELGVEVLVVDPETLPRSVGKRQRLVDNRARP